MPKILLNITVKQRMRKAKLPVSWPEVLRVGLEVIEKAVCNAENQKPSKANQAEPSSERR